MHELQQRLRSAGFLDPAFVEDSSFCDRTHAAVLAFQSSYGLRATGVCDESTWSSLVEASWALGERLLFVRSPNIRGDDVAELQTLLNRMGFDCGRVDGIFGPLLAHALSDFQQNAGLEANGVCTPELVTFLKRMGSQTGGGPGIAVVRQSVVLGDAEVSSPRRITVGSFTGATHVAHAITRELQRTFPLATTIDSDSTTHAKAANDIASDVYLGIETAESGGCVLYFYSVPAFVSIGGRNLAQRVASFIGSRIPELDVRVEGARHPVLRETRMPAVLCLFAPADIAHLKASALARAVTEAVAAWTLDPLAND